jgi:hypothetical protein
VLCRCGRPRPTNRRPRTEQLAPAIMTSNSSRTSSVHSQIRSQHAPLIPGNLRHFREPQPSVEETLTRGVMPRDAGSQPMDDSFLEGTASAEIIENEVSAYTHLLGRRRSSHAHPGPCDHGTFSPRPATRNSTGSYSPSRLNFRDTFGGPEWDDNHLGEPGGSSGLAGLVEEGLMGGKKKMRTTHWLARRHGLRHTKSMFVNTGYTFLVTLGALLMGGMRALHSD